MGMLKTNAHPRRASQSNIVSENKVLTVVSAGSRTLKVSRSTQVHRFNRRIQTEPEVSLTPLVEERPRDQEMAVQTSARSVSHSFATANMASSSTCTFSIFNKSQLSSASEHKPPVGSASHSSSRPRQELSSLSVSHRLPAIPNTDFLPLDSPARHRRPSLTCSSMSGSFQDLQDTFQHCTSPCSLQTSEEISTKAEVQVSTKKTLVSQHHLSHHHHHYSFAQQQQQQSDNSNTIGQYLEALNDRYFSPITQRFIPGSRKARKTAPKPSHTEAFVLSRQPAAADGSSQSSLAIPVPPETLSSSSTSSTAPADMPSSSVDFQPPVYFSCLPQFTESVSSTADSPTRSTVTTLINTKPPHIPSSTSKEFFSQYRGKMRGDRRRGFKTPMLHRTLSNQSSSSIYTKLIKSPSPPNSDEIVITVGRDSVSNTSLMSLSNQPEPRTPVNGNCVNESSSYEQLDLLRKWGPDTADIWQQSSSVVKDKKSEEEVICRLQNNLITDLIQQNKSTQYTQTTSSISFNRRESSQNEDNAKDVSVLSQSWKKSVKQETYSKTVSQLESSSLEEERLPQGALPIPEVKKQSSSKKTIPSTAKLERDTSVETKDTQPEDVIISFEYRNFLNDAQPNYHTNHNPPTQSQKNLNKLERQSPEESEHSEELIISVSSYHIQNSPNQRTSEAFHKPTTVTPKKERHSENIYIAVSDNNVQNSLQQTSPELDSNTTAACSAPDDTTADVEAPLADKQDQNSVNQRKSLKLSYTPQPSSKSGKASKHPSSLVSDKNEQSQQQRPSSSSVKRQSLSTEDNVVEVSSIPASEDNENNSVTQKQSVKWPGASKQSSTKDRRSEYSAEDTGQEPATQSSPSNAVRRQEPRLSPIPDKYTEEMVFSRCKKEGIHYKLTSVRETRHCGSQTPPNHDYSSPLKTESRSIDYVTSAEESQHAPWFSAHTTLLSNKGGGKSSFIESERSNDGSKVSIHSKEKPLQTTTSFTSGARSTSSRKENGTVQPATSVLDKDTPASQNEARSASHTDWEPRQIRQVSTTASRDKIIAIQIKNLTHLVISGDRSASGSPTRTPDNCDGHLIQSRVNFVDSLTDDVNLSILARTSLEKGHFQTTHDLTFPKASPLTIGSLPKRSALHPGTSQSLNVEFISRYCQTDPVSILPGSPVLIKRQNQDQNQEFNQISSRRSGPIFRILIGNNSKPTKPQLFLDHGTQANFRNVDSEAHCRKNSSNLSQQTLAPQTKSSTSFNVVRSADPQHDFFWDATAASHHPPQSAPRYTDHSLQAQQKTSPAQPKSMYLLDYSHVNSSGSQNSSISPASGHPPQTVICYLCGRQYGTASIGLHEKRCLAQLLQYNQRLPPHLQRPIPTKSDADLYSVREIHGSKTGTYDLDSINQASFAALTTQYVPCLRCKRTFLPESLEVHARICRGQFKKRGTPI